MSFSLPVGEPWVVAERLLGQCLADGRHVVAPVAGAGLISFGSHDEPGLQEPPPVVVPCIAVPQTVVVGLHVVVGKVVDHVVVTMDRVAERMR